MKEVVYLWHFLIKDDWIPKLHTFSTLISSSIMMAISFMLYKCISFKLIIGRLELFKTITIFAYAVIFCLGIYFINSLYYASSIQLKPIYVRHLSVIDIPNLIANVIIIPYIEEVFFRGVILQKLMSIFNGKLSILISSIWFIMAHIGYNEIVHNSFNLIKFLGLFIGSVICSILFMKSNSVGNGLIFHSSVNAILICFTG